MKSVQLRSISVALTLGAIFCAGDARGQESSGAASVAPAPRAWLYVDDARALAPLETASVSRVTFTSVGSGAIRPFASDLAHPGNVLESGAEVGVVRGLSVAATGFTDRVSPDQPGASGMTAGFRLVPFESAAGRMQVAGGVLRELSGNHGAWARVSVARDFGRVRLATTVHGEHVFAGGRDALDVMVIAGASYRVLGPLRVGAEYVAQDLEGALDGDTEGGARHFLGPTVGLEIAPQRLTLTAGPALGLSAASPQAVGRMALAYSF